MTTTSSLFLLYTFELDVGAKRVQLYGLTQVINGEFRFSMDAPPYDAHLFPADQVTREIHEPLGLTGVVVEDLGLDGRVYMKNGQRSIDLAIRAKARFTSSSLAHFAMQGAIVIDDSTPRLAMVALAASPPLTLTQFLSSVFGAGAAWAATVTDQFAFVRGAIYALRAPKDAKADYVFTYDRVTYVPGYGVESKIILFQKYEFDISLLTNGDEFALVTRSPTTINAFDFIELTKTSLEISSKKSDTHLRVKSAVRFFESEPTFNVIADYNTGQERFVGHVDANLGSISIPNGSGSSARNVTLSIDFGWTADSGTSGSGKSNGLVIIAIGGLPTNGLDLISHYLRALNNLRGSKCREIVRGWLDGLSVTTFKPALNPDSKPTRRADGVMVVPLQIKYEMEMAGRVIVREAVPFDAKIALPKSLSELPEKIWSSIIGSLPGIAEDILGNRTTYEIIAIEVSRRAGASAAASFLCTMLEKGLEDMAKRLAKVAETLIADSIAAAAELAGALMGVALLGVKGVLSAFEELWDAIKDFFTGGDSKREEREAAERQIRDLQAKVEGAVSGVDKLVAKIKGEIGIRSLDTGLDDSGRFVASVDWNIAGDKGLAPESILQCHLRLLTGHPGAADGTIIADAPNQRFPLAMSWSDIPHSGDYQFNAAVRPVLKGFTFIGDQTVATMNSAINQIGNIDNGTAQQFANYLKGKRDEFLDYNRNGLTGDWVYAHTGTPHRMTVGKSRIGVNSRIST
ncbi:MAG: hypothetical protein V4550_10620 [Gemmatimonadota bacterium]